jgi:DNA polymerase-3 subunit alpha
MDDKKILFGLSHIRGVGRSAVEVISRLKLDTFKDFVSNLKKIHRNVAESLIKSGACDCYGHSRTKMLRMVHIVLGRTDGSGENIPAEVRKLTPNEFNQFIKEIDRGFEEALKSIITTGKCIPKRVPTIEAKINYINQAVADTNTQKAIWEKLYLGLNLTCSAADDYKKQADDIRTCKQVHHLQNKKKFVVHVVLDQITEKTTGEKSKNPGQKFAFIKVSDNSAALQLAVWPKQYEKFKDNLIEGTVVELYGYKDSWQGRDQITVNGLELIG